MPRKKADEGSGRRSEVVTVRLDPRLKYLAEVSARKQRRPLSGFIEWAVEQSLDRVNLRESPEIPVTVAQAERSHRLWDVDEADRVARLALHFPELLTYDEQLIWRLVRSNGYVWRGQYAGADSSWQWVVGEKQLLWDRLREHWETFKGVAAGRISVENLPTWARHDPKPKDDDDI